MPNRGPETPDFSLLDLHGPDWREWIVGNLREGCSPETMIPSMLGPSWTEDQARAAIAQGQAWLKLSAEGALMPPARIFVSVAAFCEPFLLHTLSDAQRKARFPESLVFAVVDQEEHDRRETVQQAAGHAKVRYVRIAPHEARGVCWARSLAFSLYEDEEFLLQIDSHMHFEQDWDVTLRREWERLAAEGGPRQLLTAYPPAFEFVNGEPVPQRRTDTGMVWVLRPNPAASISEHDARIGFVTESVVSERAVPGYHIAAGFFFTHGSFVHEVPYDPYLYFLGEEQSLALRCYTRGWNIWHPVTIPIYHLYKMPTSEHRNHHWHKDWEQRRDFKWSDLDGRARRRLLQLLKAPPGSSSFGLGTTRSLGDYARFSGIDYTARRIRPRYASAEQPATLTVLEVNAFAPRPYVFTDFALCLVESFRRAGIAARHSANDIPEEGAMVVMGWTPAWLEEHRGKLPRSRTVLFNAEQLGSTSPLLTPAYLQALGQWPVIDYHEANAARIRQMHGADACVAVVPVIPESPVAFGTPVETDAPIFDVLFYGTLTPRRERIVQDLRALGLNVEVVAGAYGPELAPALKRARLVLHVHSYDTGLYPALRMLQPIAQGVPIVCETSVFSAENDWHASGMVFADYEALVAACQALLADPSRAAQAAQKCREFAALMMLDAELAPLKAVLATG